MAYVLFAINWYIRFQILRSERFAEMGLALIYDAKVCRIFISSTISGANYLQYAIALA
jgi:hypothetical protein